MWTTFEVKKVQEMYANLQEESLEDILPSDLIDVIKADGGMAYENLRYIVFTIFL